MDSLRSSSSICQVDQIEITLLMREALVFHSLSLTMRIMPFDKATHHTPTERNPSITEKIVLWYQREEAFPDRPEPSPQLHHLFPGQVKMSTFSTLEA